MLQDEVKEKDEELKRVNELNITIRSLQRDIANKDNEIADLQRFKSLNDGVRAKNEELQKQMTAQKEQKDKLQRKYDVLAQSADRSGDEDEEEQQDPVLSNNIHQKSVDIRASNTHLSARTEQLQKENHDLKEKLEAAHRIIAEKDGLLRQKRVDTIQSIQPLKEQPAAVYTEGAIDLNGYAVLEEEEKYDATELETDCNQNEEDDDGNRRISVLIVGDEQEEKEEVVIEDMSKETLQKKYKMLRANNLTLQKTIMRLVSPSEDESDFPVIEDIRSDFETLRKQYFSDVCSVCLLMYGYIIC